MIELKEHNRKPYEVMRQKLGETSRVGFVSATGTGKSYVGAKYVEENGLEDKTLILVPSNAIRKGWKKLLPETIILTYQALLTSPIDSSQYSLIICDEVHHLGAGRWGEAFRKLTEAYEGKIIGMSATPIRFLDNSRDMVEEVLEGNRVVGIELPEAIEKGILPSFDYISALYTIPRLRKGERKGLIEKLYKKLDVMENEYSFQAIMAKHMKPGNHKVAVFVPSIPEIEKYMDVVSGIYPDALHLAAYSKMTDAAIKAAVRRFEESNQTAFIYTVDLLNEGVHIDGVDTVIMFRRTQSPTIFLQQLGRALTTNQSEIRITVFDFVANHMNLKGKHDGAGNVIDWIVEGIENPERQIIRADYAKEEWEVLKRISGVLAGLWIEEEDELIRRYYNTVNGVEKLEGLLPNRTKSAIVSRAGTLRIVTPHVNAITDEMKRDLRELYPRLDLFCKKYPLISLKNADTLAMRLGIRDKKMCRNPWTDEELEILAAHPELSAEAVSNLLPAHSIESVRLKRKQTGWKSANTWTEEEDKIIMENRDLSSKGLISLLPNRSRDQILLRRKKLNAKKNEFLSDWTNEKKERFSALYSTGGWKKVTNDPEFQWMSLSKISSIIRKLGIRVKDEYSKRRPWSEEDHRKMCEYLNSKEPKPRGSMKNFAATFPGRTYDAVLKELEKIKKTGGTKCES